MIDALLRILALIRKELLALLKDPRSRMSLLLPPVLQCLLFGYAATYDLNNVPYAVLDQDHSAASAELLSRLDGSGVFVRVASLRRAADIRDYIDNRRALLVVQIGQDFERNLHAGLPAELQVIADGRNSNTAGHGARLCRRGRRGVRRPVAGGPRRKRPAGPHDHARLVQPEPRDALEHDPGA